MTVIFKPRGTLDVSTDPSDLPEVSDGKNISSYEMQRCKNLKLNRDGIASLRDGSTQYADGPLADTAIRKLVEQGGYRYAFTADVIYRNGVSISTGNTDAEWSAMLYNSYLSSTQNIFALNGYERIRIEGSNVYKWGIDAPTVAPVVTDGGGAGLTGVYNYQYTYCRKESDVVVSESNPSPSDSTPPTLADDEVDVSWTASTDSQVTHVRLYRTLADGSRFYWEKDVAIGTTTNQSSAADSTLGSEVLTTHNRPPAGTFVFGPNYTGVSFIIKDNRLYFSLPKQPEYFPTAQYLEVSQPQYPGQCLVFHLGQCYFITKVGIHYIQGSGSDTFFPIKMDCITGAVNPNAAVSVKGKGIYHVGNDGIYLWYETDKKITHKDFDVLFEGTSVNGVPAVDTLTTCILREFKNKLYFFYEGSGDTRPSNCLVFNLETGKSQYFNWNDVEFRTVEVDYTNADLMAGGTDGEIWKLEDDSVTTDNAVAIAWDIQTKDFTLPTRAHFPRWAKYDIDASDENNVATANIMLDGSSVQSHSLSENRKTTRRLIATSNGQKMSIRVNGTGPVSIHTIEAE